MRARGVVKIGEVKARWVHGYHVRVKGRHYIYSETRERLSVWDFTEIYPLSLALETGRTDRRGKAIFGSYPVDGKMSKGGDRVRKPGLSEDWDEYDVKFSNGCFYLPDNWEFTDKWGHCEIIGSQWEAKL